MVNFRKGSLISIGGKLYRVIGMGDNGYIIVKDFATGEESAFWRSGSKIEEASDEQKAEYL